MELGDILGVLRARRMLVLVAAVAAVLLAAVVTLLQPRLFEAEANLLVSESGSEISAIAETINSGFSTQPERGLQTQARLLRLKPAFERAIKKMDLRVSPNELMERTEVVADGPSNVISIRVRDESAADAAALANTLASEYVLWARELNRVRIQAASEEVKKQLSEARSQLRTLSQDADQRGDDIGREREAALQIAAANYMALSQRLQELKVSEEMEIGPVQVVDEAAVPPSPVSPRPLLNIALALGLGLAVGVALALVAEQLDMSIKSPKQAEELLGAPLIGVIPFERSPQAGLAVLARSPGAASAEAFRTIRNALDFINFEHSIHSIVVTSSVAGEGKSTTTANLALGLAQAGKNVVLVGADFRRPRTAELLGVYETVGLSDVLTGSLEVQRCLQASPEERLSVLAAGKLPPNPSELLGSRRMGELVQELSVTYDWVILDTPPVLAVADTTAVTKWTNGAIVVVRIGETRRDDAMRAVQALEAAGSRVLGLVALDSKAQTGVGSYSKYGYSSYSPYAPYGPAPEK